MGKLESPDPLIREVAKKRFEFAYKYARLLGAPHIILHHGYVPHTSGHAGWLARSLEFWRVFLADKDPDTVFYLENLLEPDSKLIGQVVRQLDQPNLKICFDVGHAFCHGKIPLKEWVEDLGPLIGYVHLHDNNGDVDAHLSLGEGRLPLDHICYTLKRRAPDALWALEVGPENLAASYFWLERHGYLSFSGD
ncbi:MAG TPA: sugar phosphate isomerase/epimerase [Firmicutes bacterium]|nr:sugar phosphate isomerase/epimerase [Bacillota bacterium]